MQRTAYIALACAILLAALPGLALAAPPAGIELKAQVGYDGYVQQGRINPIIVDVTNNSAGTNVDGELILRYNDIEYVTPLELPTPSAKRIFLYFPCDNYAPFLSLQVRSKQWNETYEMNQHFKSNKAADTSILVIGSQSGELGVLNQLETVRLHRNLYVNSAASIGGSKTYVGYFKLDEIDPNPKFFARADVVVLSDIDYEQVTPQLAETLKACAAGGTSIVFSLGLNGAGLAGSALEDLCPLAVTGTRQLSSLGSLTQRYGIQPGGMLATYAVGQVKPGASVVADSDGVPAVVRQRWGSGTVTALAFDYSARPFRQNPQLAALFLDTTLSVPENVEVRNWFVHPEPLTKILQRLAEADPMQPLFVLLFLLAYVVLVGPVNFLLLRALKRQTLVWMTIPLIIVSFAYAGLETGRLTRGSDNVTSSFQEVHVYPGASYTPYQSVLMIFTAERTRYSLKVPDKSAFLFASIPQQLDPVGFSGMNPARQFRGLTQGQLDNTLEPTVETTQGKWTMKDYFYQGYAQLPITLAADIKAQPMERGAANATGTFTLNMPFDLDHCYLYGGGGSKQIGRLAGQGTHDIAELVNGAQTQSDTTGEAEDYLLAARSEISDLQRSATGNAMLYRDELLLVGFTREIEPLAKFGNAHKDYQLSMVVIHLPFTPVQDPLAAPETRTIIAGGNGFEVDTPWGYGGPIDEELKFKQDSYVDLNVQLLGKARRANRLTIRTNGRLGRDKMIERISEHVTVYAWSGTGWREVRATPGMNVLDLPMGGVSDSNGLLRLRLVAKTDDLTLSMPRAEAYGGI